ncbi:hypothetical protein Fuma_03045 [Fuerstiella marisgermanici]|uniref:Chromosome partitioning protein ParB n=1 Tax=Fuerstiella marisgermanici TaxID=1891926 RepID=A0A1P8WHA5_9PLAN|nr:hypothetical protein Fuma_03045 [Fuerstiella marisgermanici]
MSKDVSFRGTPPSKENPRATEAFKALGLSPKPEKTKRLTVDVPVSLHSRVKLECCRNDVAIADVVRRLLESEFPGQT